MVESVITLLQVYCRAFQWSVSDGVWCSYNRAYCSICLIILCI